MNVLTTERLVLAPLTHALVTKRLESDSFEFEVIDVGTVEFSPHWPGDGLGMFTALRATADDP